MNLIIPLMLVWLSGVALGVANADFFKGSPKVNYEVVVQAQETCVGIGSELSAFNHKEFQCANGATFEHKNTEAYYQ